MIHSETLTNKTSQACVTWQGKKLTKILELAQCISTQAQCHFPNIVLHQSNTQSKQNIQ